jgi:hypothetical protein
MTRKEQLSHKRRKKGHKGQVSIAIAAVIKLSKSIF